jgi:hypothetical protein
MSNRLAEQCCDNCRFFYEESRTSDVGECRRFPPVIGAPYRGDIFDQHDIAKVTIWPVVSYTLVCGEWKQK